MHCRLRLRRSRHARGIRPQPRATASHAPRLCTLLVLAAAIAGCTADERIEAVIARTDAFCAAHPAHAWPAPVDADALYVGAGAPMETWHTWIPERLLEGGFAEVESDASIAPALAGTGRYLGFRVAPATDPACAGQAAMMAALDPRERERTRRVWIEQGLRPDQCIAIERKPTRRAAYWIEAWDASAQMPPVDRDLPIRRVRTHRVLREAATGAVRHGLHTEHGFVTAGMPIPFGCLRHAEIRRFTDTLVVGTHRAPEGSTHAAGPEILDAPTLPPTLRTTPVAERVRELGRVRIGGMPLSARRTPRSHAIPGIDVLLGDADDANSTGVNPSWPRYLQLVHDGRYRRVRLSWLEGSPHGAHETPLRLFDLGDRIGLLSVTERMPPGDTYFVDLSWAEFDRADGLPRLRADAAIRVGLEPRDRGPILLEDVQRTSAGLRFRLTEVGIDSAPGDASGFVLVRETAWRWPLPANG